MCGDKRTKVRYQAIATNFPVKVIGRCRRWPAAGRRLP